VAAFFDFPFPFFNSFNLRPFQLFQSFLHILAFSLFLKNESLNTFVRLKTVENVDNPHFP